MSLFLLDAEICLAFLFPLIHFFKLNYINLNILLMGISNHF